MYLSRPMLRTLIEVVNGISSINKLSKRMHKSISWTSEIVTKLEKERFIIKKRKGLKKQILLSNSTFAQKFKEMFYMQTKLNYSDFLYGERFRILAFIADGPKTTECIAKELKISKKYVQNIIPEFLNRGMIFRKNRMLQITKRGWPKLVEFLLAYRNYSNLNGGIIWKFEKEQIFLVNKEEEIQGSLTGFSMYSKYGIKFYAVKIMCYLPKKSCTKEEVFIHSLLVILGDIKLFKLAVAFYLKNKRMSLNRLKYLAMKFNVIEEFYDVINAANSKEEVIKLNTMMDVKRDNLNQTLELYGIKNDF